MPFKDLFFIIQTNALFGESHRPHSTKCSIYLWISDIFEIFCAYFSSEMEENYEQLRFNVLSDIGALDEEYESDYETKLETLNALKLDIEDKIAEQEIEQDDPFYDYYDPDNDEWVDHYDY